MNEQNSNSTSSSNSSSTPQTVSSADIQPEQNPSHQPATKSEASTVELYEPQPLESIAHPP